MRRGTHSPIHPLEARTWLDHNRGQGSWLDTRERASVTCHARNAMRARRQLTHGLFSLFNAFIHALPVNLKEKNRKSADSFDNFGVEFVSNIPAFKNFAETTTAHGGVIGPS